MSDANNQSIVSCPGCGVDLELPADALDRKLECTECGRHFTCTGHSVVDLDGLKNSGVISDAKSFWKAVGERIDISTGDGRASLTCPMTEIFTYGKWMPLPAVFAKRLVALEDGDPVKSASDCLSALDVILTSELKGFARDELSMAIWAKKYLGARLGDRPPYDKDAETAYRNHRSQWFSQSHGRWRTMPSNLRVNPNAAYYSWRDARKSAAAQTEKALAMLREYKLRRIAYAEDVIIETRRRVLEFLVKKLSNAHWKSVAGQSSTAERWLSFTQEQWLAGGERQVCEYLRKAAEDLYAFIRYSDYDMSAVSRLIGPGMHQMLRILEESAKVKVKSSLEMALADVGSFAQSVRKSGEMGMMRENELSLTCSVYKYKIHIDVTDVGRGVVAVGKAKEAASTAVGYGLAAAAGAAVLAFPPLLGFAAIGAMITASVCDNGKRKRR